MAKAGGDVGLSFDSSPGQIPHHHILHRHLRHLHQPTVINSFPDLALPSSSSSSSRHRLLDRPFRELHPMDQRHRHHQFPVNLNSSSSRSHHDDGDGRSGDDSPHPSDLKGSGTGKVVDEMDFFAISNAAHEACEKKTTSEPARLELNVNTGLNLLTVNSSSDQSTVDDGISPNSEDKRAQSELAVLQAEVERVSSDNQRLRDMLSQVTNNYNSLQAHLAVLMQDQKHKNTDEKRPDTALNDRPVVPRQFMDLGLASAEDHPNPNGAGGDDHSPTSSDERSPEQSLGSPPSNAAEVAMAKGVITDHNGKRSRREVSPPPDHRTRGWSPNKVSRFSPPNNKVSSSVDQTEATMRKARVSVRARSEAAMITDGCQWRKYGQKMAKGNPCPRAYYRCTMAAGCPVRKQVQRCAEDRTILITTYEGNHNHPLPPAAMAMASTTSSAARMLLSGSMSSSDGMINTNFLTRTLLPCSSSMATISASAPFPTITLDLTQNPNSSSLLQSPPSQLQVPFLNPNQNFASPSAAALLPQIFGQALYNQSKFSGLQTSQDIKATQSSSSSDQPGINDTLTAALTSDPNFTAALAAAISSIIGGGSSSHASNSASNSTVPSHTPAGNNMASGNSNKIINPSN